MFNKIFTILILSFKNCNFGFNFQLKAKNRKLSQTRSLSNKIGRFKHTRGNVNLILHAKLMSTCFLVMLYRPYPLYRWYQYISPLFHEAQERFVQVCIIL